MSRVQWTPGKPHRMQVCSSWGAEYYSKASPMLTATDMDADLFMALHLQTTTTTTKNPSKTSSTTTFYREVARRVTVIAKIEWNYAGGPGRICINRQTFSLADFLRQSVQPHDHAARTFVTPRNLTLTWKCDPRSSGFFLMDDWVRQYAQVIPEPSGQNHILSFSASLGDALDKSEKEWILVTLLLYKCLHDTTA